MKVEWEEVGWPKLTLSIIDKVYDGVQQPAYCLYYAESTGHFYKLEAGQPSPSVTRWYRSTEPLQW